MKRRDPSIETPMWNDPNEPAYIRELLSAGRVENMEYDVAAGLAKHAALVDAGAPLPQWAAQSGLAGSSAWVGWVVMPIIAATAATGVWFATHPEPQQKPASAKIAPSVAAPGIQAAPQPMAAEPAPQQPSIAPAAPHVTSIPARATKPSRAAQKPRSVEAPAAAKLAAEPSKPSTAATSGVDQSVSSLAASPLPAQEKQPARAVAPAPAREPEPAAEPVAEPEQPKKAAQEQKQASESQLEREMQMLAVAQRVLGSDPARALRLAEQGEHEFPGTMFSAERKQLALLAMVKLGRLDEARRIGQPFLAKYPNAPWSARLKRALATGRVE